MRLPISLLVAIVLLIGHVEAKCDTQSQNAVEFSSTNTDVAVETDVPQLSALTACTWTKSAVAQVGTLVSYSVPGADNEFIMYDTSGLDMYVKKSKKETSLNINDGEWHLVCGTWASSGGSWAIYDNGIIYAGGTGLKTGSTITAGGSLVVGQEQDSMRGGYAANQAFTGTMGYFSMWSRALSADEIAEVDCSSGGDVFTWSISGLDVRGDVDLVCSDVCEPKPASCENAVEFSSTTTDVAVEIDVPQLSALTACTWTKSAVAQVGTLVSYVVPGGDNEFILYDTSGLNMFVKKSKKETSLNINDGEWHLVCGTWASSDGSWAIYDNGILYAGGTGLKTGSTITAGGSLVVGQEQDSMRGGYAANQAFTGTMAYFSMWSRALSADEIAEVDCSSGGDVFTWSISGLDLRGDVDLVCSDVCECAFPDDLVNVAVGKPASQSSGNKKKGAEKAVDGNKDSDLKKGKSCTATKKEFQPWWKVDLGQSYDVYKVVITNRQDCCAKRLKNAEVRVGDNEDFSKNPLCGDVLSGDDVEDETITIECGCETPMNGRYVSVQLIVNKQVLTLCEVDVMVA
ncbi:uncharacterized protein LOC144446160 [Glandiceps talaboti]